MRYGLLDGTPDDEFSGVRIVSAQQTCAAYPSQWDVWTDDGSKLYVRYRFGRLKVFPYDIDNHSKILFDRILVNWQLGDQLDGIMTTEDMKTLLQTKEF